MFNKYFLFSTLIIGGMKPLDKGVFHGMWEQEPKTAEH